MCLSFPTRNVNEGAASLLVPELIMDEDERLDHAIARAPVFYNIRMKMNRDSAVLALGEYQKRLAKPVSICEPMCGTGVRGIRLALEVAEVDAVVLGDLNPNATTLARENTTLNGLNDVVSVCLVDANLLLSLHDRPRRRFHYIDVDPYGSPSPFMDSAVRASRNHGMVAFTATDMAPLCGVNPAACLRKYGGLPLRSEYCHEVALRLVVSAVVETAARHKVAAQPVFSYAADHYVRLYFSLDRGARKADRSLGQVGFLLHCFVCHNRRVTYLRELGKSGVCNVCGFKMEFGGPMWLGKLADEVFCEGMLSFSERSDLSSNLRLMRLIKLVQDEVGFPPGFFNIDKLCSRLRVASISTNEVLFALRKEGFKAVRTHIDDRGIKTDASIIDLENVLKGISGRGVGGF